MPAYKRTQPADKLDILKLRASGLSAPDIAKRLGRSKTTIMYHLNQLNRAKRPAQDEFDATVARNTLRIKGYKAVEAGLDCDEDAYKRGSLGVATLKGLGDFAADNPSTSINVFYQAIQQLPPDWRNQYVSGDDDDPTE